MTTRQDQIAQRERGIEVMREHLKRGDVLWTRTDYGTGQTDYVRVYVARTNEIEDVTYFIARACDLRMNDRGIKVPGGGLNKSLHVIDNLYRTVLGTAADQARWRELR